MRTALLSALTFLMFGCQPPVSGEPDGGSFPAVDSGVSEQDAGVADAGLVCGSYSHVGDDGGCATDLAWHRSRFGPTGRDHHASWLWPAPDGGAVLVVAGGIDKWAGDAFIDSMFANIDADGTVHEWNAGPALPVWQTGMAVVAGESRVYLVGGMTLTSGGSTTPTSTVQSIAPTLDGAPDEWREELNLPFVTFYPSASRVGDWLFVVGGRAAGGRALADVARARIGADGVLSDWVVLPSLDVARTHHGAFVVGNRLFLIAGFDATSFTASQDNHADLLSTTVDLATGALGPWTSTPLGFDASSFSVEVFDGWVYVIGGFDGFLRLKADVRRARLNADGSVGAFEQLPPLPIARAHVRQTPIRNGVIYSFGGSFMSSTNDALHVGTLW